MFLSAVKERATYQLAKEKSTTTNTALGFEQSAQTTAVAQAEEVELVDEERADAVDTSTAEAAPHEAESDGITTSHDMTEQPTPKRD